jgi:hypothetical protein
MMNLQNPNSKVQLIALAQTHLQGESGRTGSSRLDSRALT